MKYITAAGDIINVTVGDAVYVDEGDSIGMIKYTADVLVTDSDGMTVSMRSNAGIAIVDPMGVADIQVLP